LAGALPQTTLGSSQRSPDLLAKFEESYLTEGQRKKGRKEKKQGRERRKKNVGEISKNFGYGLAYF